MVFDLSTVNTCKGKFYRNTFIDRKFFNLYHRNKDFQLLELFQLKEVLKQKHIHSERSLRAVETLTLDCSTLLTSLTLTTDTDN